MSLQSSYSNKDKLYNNTLSRLAGVNAGTPRQLKYKFIVFSNLASKRQWIKDQESTLKQLERVLRRLSSKIYISKAA